MLQICAIACGINIIVSSLVIVLVGGVPTISCTVKTKNTLQRGCVQVSQMHSDAFCVVVQESLYDQYKQREQTIQDKGGLDVLPDRFATLTQQWVQQNTYLAKALGSGIRQDGIALSSPAIPSTALRQPAAASHITPQEPADMGELDVTLHRLQRGPSTSTALSSRGSPLAAALSRSVGVVTQLAQHVKSGTHRPSSGAPFPGDRKASALTQSLKRSDVFQQAIIGASIHASLNGQGLSHDQRAATVELMQQAGVISRYSTTYCSGSCLYLIGHDISNIPLDPQLRVLLAQAVAFHIHSHEH